MGTVDLDEMKNQSSKLKIADIDKIQTVNDESL